MIFAAMHVAQTLDHARLRDDPAYRDAVIRELCGEDHERRNPAGPRTDGGNPNAANDSLPHAA